MEEWRDIKAFPGYQVSNEGRVRTHNKVTSSVRFPERHWKDRIISQKVGKDKCSRVELWRGKEHKTVLVHRLVANEFLERMMDTDLTVNHKDGNRQNNNVSNLEWVTRADNIRHGFRTGLYATVENPCRLESTDGKERRQFKSLEAAGRFLGRGHGYCNCIVSRGMIARSIDGKKYKVFLED